MKFKYKIFLITFILVIVITNVIGISIINRNFKNEILREVNQNILKIKSLATLTDTESSFLSSLANNYISNNTFTMVEYKDEVIFTNYDNNIIKHNLKFDENNKIEYYIKDKAIYMGLKRYDYTIYTISYIEDIYVARDELVKYFIMLDLICSLVVALILSLVVYLITRKINKLEQSVKKIKNKEYNEKIPKLGNDEFGEFASVFDEMRESIKNNIEEIERVSENRKIFIGNLTHEIRTPLTTIIGYSSLIKNKKITDLEEIVNCANKIHYEGKYIEEMRDKLMSLSLLENGNISLTNENISNELTDIVNDLKIVYKKANFKTEISSKVYAKIDKSLFRSLIINIVNNSIKASNKPKITIYLDSNQLIISDNGKGIPKNELKKVKEPFYTLNKDRNRKKSGMGLGLALVTKIVETFNWDFEIESEIDKYTEINICFRRKK